MKTLMLGIILFIFYCEIKSETVSPLCFERGECKNGNFIAQSTTMGENACLKFCQLKQDCKWFTYHPLNRLCIAYSECSILSTEQCPDCLSGQTECEYVKLECWVKGICHGTLIHEIITSSQEECHQLCLSTEDCAWFSYDAFPSACYLLKDCPTLDETCTSCISSNSKCQGLTGFTKLLVGLGHTGIVDSKDIIIIDLEISSSKCEKLPDFPHVGNRIVGGITFQGGPMICGGGWPINNECHTFVGSQWEHTFPLTDALIGASITKSPFLKENYPLIITGGANLNEFFFNTTQVLTEKGWDNTILPPMPFSANEFCTSVLNSTSIVAIVGDRSFILGIDSNEWNVGPQTNVGHYGQGCARIRRNNKDMSFSVIVVGQNAVEILDDGESQWRFGPVINIQVQYGELVEDPLGGVILVGGELINGHILDKIFRLAHAEAEWEELSQKLPTPLLHLTAFFIPDYLTNCTIN